MNDQPIDLNNARTVIKSAADRIMRLKSEKAEIQAQITEVKSEVKAVGVKMTDFNAALRLYELEAEDRNESLDNLRICFQALGVGEQGQLFPAVAASNDEPLGEPQAMEDDQPAQAVA